MTFPRDWVGYHNGERIVISLLGLKPFSMANVVKWVCYLLGGGEGNSFVLIDCVPLFLLLLFCQKRKCHEALPGCHRMVLVLDFQPWFCELWTSLLPKHPASCILLQQKKLILIMMRWNQIVEREFPLFHKNIVLKTLPIRAVLPERVQQEHLLIGVRWLAFPKHV